MKKNVLIIALFLTVSTVFAQKINESQVPESVKKSFLNLFPNSKVESWELEDLSYEVEFEQNEKDCSATFDSSGNLLETEVEYEYADLPNEIKLYIDKNYKVSQVKEVDKITDAKQIVTYELEMKKVDLIFDAKGNFIKQIDK